MKNGIIFAHKSTWRSRLDLEYLDETSRRKITARESLNTKPEIVRKLRQFGDYASKETLGQVHAGGFLHDLIRHNADGTSTAPSKLHERREEEAHLRVVVSPPSQISNVFGKSRHSASLGILNVRRTARQACRVRNQS